MKLKLEYIWLDGYKPEPNLRSKIKIYEREENEESLRNPLHFAPTRPEDLPLWSFDGSSTQQAEGNSSDCLLKPVRIYQDPTKGGFSFLVFCEVLNPDGTPHASNHRHGLGNDEDYWFGFEQEYVLSRDGKPLGFPKEGEPDPQGKYYCSVGYPWSAGREISEEHLDACLSCGLHITGTNAEVLLGQWEYQILGKGQQSASDDLWISRFILMRIAEKYGVQIDLRPKPLTEGDWNGSGMHVNFSNSEMREVGGEDLFESICESFRGTHSEAIQDYGSDNHLRLTGKHETQSMDKFSWGISDRGASIRIPVAVPQEGWKGYLEDRRPASNANPYKVVYHITNAIKSVSEVEA
jgi:glutamine synthetase